jgi:hypothetical protein
LKNRLTALDKGWLVAALLPLIGIIPALHGTGVVNTADGLFHTHRIYAMTQLLAAGNLYPRWIPWFHLGYGYPVLNFYAPAASYLGGLLGLIGISAPVAYTLIASLSWVGGSIGMYGLARRYLPASGALVAAALWTYAPSRLQDVWNIGNLSQIMGTALVPWVFYALARAVNQPGYRNSALLGLAFGGLILAHQPTTVLAVLFIIPGVPLLSLWTARGDWKTLFPRLMRAGAGLALGVGLSLVFTLPLIAELQYIKAASAAEDIPSVLLSNFLSVGQLFQPPAAPDLSDLSRRLPDTFGLVAGILGGLGLLALLGKRLFAVALACGAALALSLFLLLDISFNLWLTVPLLDQLRFPARMLRVGVVFLALGGGACVLFLPRRYTLAAAGALIALVIGTALPTIYPSRDVVDFADLSARDEILYELETFAFGGTSYNEFKPIWATRTPFDQPLDTEGYATHPLQINFIDPGSADVEIESIGDTVFRVQTPDTLELSFRQFYFPGWAALIDGTPVEVFPKSDLGLLTVTIPPGDHTITLYWVGTTAQNIAPILSLASLALVGILSWKDRSVPHPALRSAPPLYAVERGQGGEDKISSRFAALVAGGVIGFAALNTLVIAPQTLWFRQQSPLDAPAAMQTPLHIAFGDAYELLGYTLDTSAVAPGEALRVTLYWRALRPLDRDYRPQLQLVNARRTEAWATSEGFFVGSAPVKHTPDYFVSDVHLPRVFDDAPPYVGYLTVKLIDSQTDTPLLLPDGSEALTLDQTVRITGDGLRVNRLFDYQVGDTLELWCSTFDPTVEGIQVDLYWHVLAPSANPNLRTFIHGLDSAGNQIEGADGPPFAGDYAPSDWLPGQTLVDTYLLPYDVNMREVAVGLYVPEGDRLPATHDGQPLPDNRVLLPLGRQDCLG